VEIIDKEMSVIVGGDCLSAVDPEDVWSGIGECLLILAEYVYGLLASLHLLRVVGRIVVRPNDDLLAFIHTFFDKRFEHGA